MKYLNISLFVFVTICAPAFGVSPTNNLSTTLAAEKYGNLLKNKSFFVFPALHEEPIKWFDSIPEGNISDCLKKKSFVLNPRPGEFFVFQLGVWALKQDVKDVQIEFSDFKDGRGKLISANRLTCFNKGGIDFKGKSFSKEINVSTGRVQALWVGIDMDSIKAGDYKGSVSVLANKEKHVVPIQLVVSGEAVANHGYNEGSRLSRLNSTVGINEEITKGYIPIEVEDNTIKILGRTLKLADNGLPASIVSYFGPSNQSLVNEGEPIVDHPFRFVIEKENGDIIRLVPGQLTFQDKTPSKIVWSVMNTSDEFTLECTGQMEFDGFVDYRLKLIAKNELKIKDIRLEIPIVDKKAEYMMGLGHEGGYRAPDWKWKWDVSKNQDMLWVGGVNGGLRIKWKAENYVRPLVNIYYEFGPLKLPPSWGNGGKGGVNVGKEKDEVIINAFSANRESS